MVVGFKYQNGTLEIIPKQNAPFYSVSSIGQSKIADVEDTLNIELSSGIYGVALDKGSDVILPKATNALGLIWDESSNEELYDNMTPALDILEVLPFALKSGAGSNIRKLAKAIQKAVFETRLQQLGLVDVRKKFATPKFGYTNYVIFEMVPDTVVLEEVEPPKGDNAISNITATKITEEPTWPSHFRYALLTDEIFIPKNWLANYKPAHMTAGAGINREIEVGFILNANTKKIHMITFSPLHVLKTWSFSNEIRGFDIDDDYIYTLEKEDTNIKFRIYNWDLELVKEYVLGEYDLSGLAVMFNTLVSYNTTENKFAVFEARYAYFKIDKTIKVYDSFTRGLFITGTKETRLKLAAYTKKRWQPIDEFLWLRGYKRSDAETAAFQYETSYLFHKYKDQPETFIAKILQSETVPINATDVEASTLSTYATKMNFEDVKWGDYILTFDGEAWEIPTTDNALINFPLQIVEIEKDGKTYPVLFTDSGRQTLDETPNELTQVDTVPRGYIYQRTDNNEKEYVIVPIKYRDRYVPAQFGIIKLNIPADAIIIQYEDGTSVTIPVTDFHINENGEAEIVVGIDKYFRNGKPQFVQAFQVQGDELIPIHFVPFSITVFASTKDNFEIYDKIDVKQYQLVSENITKPTKGNAKIVVDKNIKPNYLEASVEQPVEDEVKVSQLAYRLFDEHYPEKLLYTHTEYQVDVILQKPSLQTISEDTAIITYADDSTIISKTKTNAGRVIISFSVGQGKELEPSYSIVELPTSQATIISEMPWEWIKFVRQLNSQYVFFMEAKEFLTAKGQLALDIASVTLMNNIGVKFWIPNRFKIVVKDQENILNSKVFYVVSLPSPPQQPKFVGAYITVGGSNG